MGKELSSHLVQMGHLDLKSGRGSPAEHPDDNNNNRFYE